MMEHDTFTNFFNNVLEMSDDRVMLSSEYKSGDGTLIKALAGGANVRRKDGSDVDRPPRETRGEPTSNAAQASNSNPESLLYRQSNAPAAQLSYLPYDIAHNRHPLVVNPLVSAETRSARTRWRWRC